jgi:hypothetical protein
LARVVRPGLRQNEKAKIAMQKKWPDMSRKLLHECMNGQHTAPHRIDDKMSRSIDKLKDFMRGGRKGSSTFFYSIDPSFIDKMLVVDDCVL